MKPLKNRAAGALTSAFIGAAFLTSACTAAPEDAKTASPQQSVGNEACLDKIKEEASYAFNVLHFVEQNYIDRTKIKKITDRLSGIVENTSCKDADGLASRVLNDVLSGLDPHSSYMDRKETERANDRMSGFGGVGMALGMVGDKLTVAGTYEGSPAEKAGIRPGDVIVKIEDSLARDLTLEQAVGKMRGDPDTSLVLVVNRPGLETLPGKKLESGMLIEKKLVRASITIKPSVRTIGGDIGYIHLKVFNETAAADFRKGIYNIKEQLGNGLKGYILDLRGNPGGFLNASISISDDLIDADRLIVSSRGRHGYDSRFASATPGEIADGKPVVVLMDGGSASASEIVAGALQDYGRATIITECSPSTGVCASFGKGSVQTIIPLTVLGVPATTRASYITGTLRLTTARYFTPSGHSIQGKGIVGDIGFINHRKKPDGDERREAKLKESLSNPEGEGLTAEEKARTKEICTAARTDVELGTSEEGLLGPDGKIDYHIAAAVEKLRGGTPSLTKCGPKGP